MGKETVLFKMEEKMARSSASDLLRQIADKLDTGKVKLIKGEKKQVSLKIPERVELEIKAEKEVSKKKTKMKIEFEVEWLVGDEKSAGPFRIE